MTFVDDRPRARNTESDAEPIGNAARRVLQRIIANEPDPAKRAEMMAIAEQARA
jgi:hypothetical protein